MGYVASFGAPVLLLCLLCGLSNIYPFGTSSFLAEDLKFQYVDFFTWYRGVLVGKNSIFYSFAQALGSNTWGMYSYYLASPFNLLLLCFDEAHITLAIFVICLVKVGCIGVTCALYVRKRFELGWSASLALVLGFAGSTWLLSNLRNPLWLDAIVLMPLILLAAWRFVRTGKWGALCACVVGLIITCWYMAYLMLVFTTLMVFFELYLYHLENAVTGRYVARLALRYACCMVVALLLCAWTFVPTVIAQMSAGSDINNYSYNIYSPTLMCRFTNMLRAMFAAGWSSQEDPQLYCGLFAFVLAMNYFASKGDCRRKLAAAVMLGLLGLSVWLIPLEVFWCGMRYPNGFFCRIAFAYIFFVLWLAAAGMKELASRGTSVLRVVFSGVVVLAPLALVAVLGRVSSTVVLVNAVLVVVYSVLLALFAGHGGRGLLRARLVPAVALLALVAELIYSGGATLAQLYGGYEQEEHDAYMASATSQVQELASYDSSVYRFEKTYSRQWAALNEGLSTEAMQLSQYSSSHNYAAIDFLNTLGYSNMGDFSTSYTSPILLMDTLLGVKYVESSYPLPGMSAIGSGSALTTTVDTSVANIGTSTTSDVVAADATTADNNNAATTNSTTTNSANTSASLSSIAASAIYGSGSSTIYANPSALSLGYGVSSDVLDATLDTSTTATSTNDTSTNDTSTSAESSARITNPFETQNQLVSALVGANTACYQELQATQISTTGTESVWSVEVPANAIGYVYLASSSAQDMYVTVDEQTAYDNWRFSHAMRFLNTQSETAQTIQVTITAGYGTLDGIEPLFYALDMSVYQQVIDQLSANQLQVSVCEGNKLEGTYQASEDGYMLLSVPYDAGWTLSINGEEVQAQPAFDGALMMIPVSAGTNNLTMFYISPGFVPGCIVTCISAALLLGLAIFKSLKFGPSWPPSRFFALE